MSPSSSIRLVITTTTTTILLLFLLLASPSVQQAPVPTYQLMFDECPTPEKLHPCTCLPESRQIICNSSITNSNDLRYIFAEASSSTQLKFAHLIFANSPLEKLVSRSFNNFHFLALTIQGHYYLSTFEEGAFEPSNQGANTLKLDGNPKLGYTNESVYSLFAAVQTFTRLSTLVIHRCGLSFIPPNAFTARPGTLQQLRRVSLLGNAIKTLCGGAFNRLPNLRNINLSGNQLERVESGAIRLNAAGQCTADHHQYGSYEKLFYTLDLSNNRLTPASLNSTSIRVDCSTELNLSNNSVTFLPQSTFRPLFGQFVKISLLGNRLDCSHCQMAWLLKGRYCPAYNSTIHYHSLVESVCDATTLSLAAFKAKCAAYLLSSAASNTGNSGGASGGGGTNTSGGGSTTTLDVNEEQQEAMLLESEADLLQCPSEGPNSGANCQPPLFTVILLNLSALLVPLLLFRIAML